MKQVTYNVYNTVNFNNVVSQDYVKPTNQIQKSKSQEQLKKHLQK
jgi:hypothetical protein